MATPGLGRGTRRVKLGLFPIRPRGAACGAVAGPGGRGGARRRRKLVASLTKAPLSPARTTASRRLQKLCALRFPLGEGTVVGTCFLLAEEFPSSVVHIYVFSSRRPRPHTRAFLFIQGERCISAVPRLHSPEDSGVRGARGTFQ